MQKGVRGKKIKATRHKFGYSHRLRPMRSAIKNTIMIHRLSFEAVISNSCGMLTSADTGASLNTKTNY